MKFKISLAVIALYLLSLMINAPATLLTRFMPDNADVEIGYASGTVWSGTLSQVTYLKKFKLQKLSWEFDWLALVTLKLKADLTFDNGQSLLNGVASVAYGLSGVEFSDVNIDMKATEIVPYLQLPIPVTPSGKFSLKVEHATQGTPYCGNLDGYLVWHDALVLTSMANIDLGSPSVDLSCSEGNLVASLTQDSEELVTNARIVLSEGERYQIAGDIMAGKKLDPTVAQAISWIGPKNSTGSTILKLDGRL